MVSPVVGVILMLAIEIVAGVAYFGTRDEWNGKPDSGLTWPETREACRCNDPPGREDGTPCEPLFLPTGGIAWKCSLPEKLKLG